MISNHIQGFTVTKQVQLPELNAVLYQMAHDKTGLGTVSGTVSVIPPTARVPPVTRTPSTVRPSPAWRRAPWKQGMRSPLLTCPRAASCCLSKNNDCKKAFLLV